MINWRVAIHPLADAELMALPADMQARYLRIVELLESFGPMEVGMPHVRPLGSKLWEMRMKGRTALLAQCTRQSKVIGCWCYMLSSKRRKRLRRLQSKRLWTD